MGNWGDPYKCCSHSYPNNLVGLFFKQTLFINDWSMCMPNLKFQLYQTAEIWEESHLFFNAPRRHGTITRKNVINYITHYIQKISNWLQFNYFSSKMCNYDYPLLQKMLNYISITFQLLYFSSPLGKYRVPDVTCVSCRGTRRSWSLHELRFSRNVFMGQSATRYVKLIKSNL